MIKLDDSITTIPQINNGYSSSLKRLGITSVRELITHFPRKYTNNTNLVDINLIKQNPNVEEVYILKGFVKDFKSARIRGGRSIQTAIIDDHTGEIKCTWFNQPFLKNVLKINKEFLFSGKVRIKGNKIDFFPTLYEPVIENRESVHLNRITPEYSLTEGISKKWFRNRIKWLTDNIGEIEIPDELENLNITKKNLKANIKSVHFPENENSFFESIKEISLYELTDIHLRLLKKRAKKIKGQAVEINKSTEIISQLKNFIDELPFELTSDQSSAIKEITAKIINKQSIDLLLQGDVGSGKTIVAICASLIISLSGFQSIILAPTTILAKQHYNTFKNFLNKFNLTIELVTSETNIRSSADILIGTTAVLARKSDLINNPGIIIIDEQHKFGVKQREDLFKEYKFIKNNKYLPHVINMSATPIPRSVLQVFFGDLEVIRITEKPKNRIPIKTFVVPEDKRKDSLEWIKGEISKGGQVYWVCSLINENEESEIKSAEKTYKELKKYMKKDVKIGILHGKMKESEKLTITNNFSEHKIDILVSTTVIEVGIDVPNANIMIIEDADRFGLSQLHQIRGRVGRGENQSWCFLYASKNISENGIKRLKFLTENEDGFEIAEFDLKNRGPGEIYGVQQAGIPNLKIADLSDFESIKKSKIIAEKLFKKKICDIKLFKW